MEASKAGYPGWYQASKEAGMAVALGVESRSGVADKGVAQKMDHRSDRGDLKDAGFRELGKWRIGV